MRRKPTGKRKSRKWINQTPRRRIKEAEIEGVKEAVRRRRVPPAKGEVGRKPGEETGVLKPPENSILGENQKKPGE